MRRGEEEDEEEEGEKGEEEYGGVQSVKQDVRQCETLVVRRDDPTSFGRAQQI